jgi:CubicO group peptidase (beta-lactamase class C family)
MTRARRVLAVAALAWTSVPYGAAAQVAAQVAAVKDRASIAPQVAAPQVAAPQVAAPQVAAPDAPQATGAPRRAQLAAAFPEVGRILEDYARRAHVPGFAFGILVDGDLVYARGFGVRDLASKSPADTDTVFRIASMTKSFTAMAILALRDTGKLALDDPAERYVPELASLVYPTRDSAPITIRQLLSHAEGFPEDNPWGDRQLAVTEAQFTEMMRRGIPFSTTPGTAFEYSNYGFAILGRIVAKASGMRYRDYVDATILRPLGMTATAWEPSAVPPQRLARGYRWANDTWDEEPMLADGAFGAMGGLMTSVNDLARYVSFLMSAWPPRDAPERGPIRRSSAREMQQVAWGDPPAVTRDSVDGPLRATGGGYGFGLRITHTCRWREVSHGGGLPGFGSTMRWLPDHGVGIVVLGNRTYAGWATTVDRAMEALARTGGLVAARPRPAPALLAAQEGVAQLLRAWDDGLADRLAADNLFLDESRERRRQRFAQLRERHGVCRSEREITPENALRGEWRMACERGWVDAWITLAPTLPPRVQFLATRSVLPLTPSLSTTMTEVAGAIGVAAQPASLGRAFAGEGAAGPGRAAISAAAPWGTCTLGDVLDGDGASRATVRLSCERGALDAWVTAEPVTGRLTALTLAPVASGCLP